MLAIDASEHRCCPICGSDGGVEMAPAHVDPRALDAFAFSSRKEPELMHHRLLQCEACDCLYASPAPTPASLVLAYNGAGYDSSAEARLAAATYERYLRRFRSSLPQGGAVDIGAGDGAFVARLLGLGFSEVFGIEPSQAALDEAPHWIRPLIHHDVFRTGILVEKTQALIACMQTIEHVPDPLGLCQAAFHGLVPGGAIMLVAHNRRARLNRLLGRRSPIYDIEHLQLLSPRSVRILLTRAGFTGITVAPIVNSYPSRYWVRLAPLPKAVKGPLIRGLTRTGLGSVLIPLPVGNMMAVGYRPQEMKPA